MLYQAGSLEVTLLFEIIREIAGSKHAAGIKWDAWSGDPEIPGIAWTASQGTQRGQFSFDGVEFKWLGRPDMSTEVNKVWDAARWIGWSERCLLSIRKYAAATRGAQKVA